MIEPHVALSGPQLSVLEAPDRSSGSCSHCALVLAGTPNKGTRDESETKVKRSGGYGTPPGNLGLVLD